MNSLIIFAVAAGALMIIGAGFELLTGRSRSEVDKRLQQNVSNPTSNAT